MLVVRAVSLQVFLCHGCQFHPGDGLAVFHQIEVRANGQRRGAMIAGDHLHDNASPMAGFDGFDSLLPRWIDHADQPQKTKAVLNGLRQQFVATRLPRFRGKREHPHAVCPHTVHLCCNLLMQDRITRLKATFEDHLRCALEHHGPLVATVQGGHVLIFRGKGNRVEPGVLTVDLRRPQALPWQQPPAAPPRSGRR